MFCSGGAAWRTPRGESALDKRDLAAPGILIFAPLARPQPSLSFICLFSYCNSSAAGSARAGRGRQDGFHWCCVSRGARGGAPPPPPPAVRKYSHYAGDTANCAATARAADDAATTFGHRAYGLLPAGGRRAATDACWDRLSS